MFDVLLFVVCCLLWLCDGGGVGGRCWLLMICGLFSLVVRCCFLFLVCSCVFVLSCAICCGSLVCCRFLASGCCVLVGCFLLVVSSCAFCLLVSVR